MHTKDLFRDKIERFTLPVVAGLLLILHTIHGWPLEIPSAPARSTDSLITHARYLASSELTGRGVDTPGIKLASDYIAREFARYGLIPGGDNGTYLQGFDVTTGVAVKAPTELLAGEERVPLRVDTDWIPLGLSASGKAEGEVVFAGYGITSKEYGYDDYAGIDAQGKIALVLRYEPPPKDEKSPFRKPPRYSTHSALRTKANNARDHGAIGMILVDLNRSGDPAKELLSTRSSLWRSSNRILAAQIKRSIVEKWLELRGFSLAALKERIDRAQQPASMLLPGVKVSLTVTLEEIRQRTENVIGILPGSDLKSKEEHVVIGAHYDHLGFGHFGTLDSDNEGQIHYGADDNASGTAVLLQLAERLSRQPKPARTIVFCAFSGEELGLHGSRHYVNHPALPLSSTIAMLNLDMVGRLRDNRVTAFGSRSAREFTPILTEAAVQAGLEVRHSDSIGRSDHMPFYNKQIPVLHFFTGTHADYHRPTDTWEKLNFDGMAKVSDFVAITLQKLATRSDPLHFVSLPARPSLTGDAEKSFSAYLGSIPDYEGSGRGVRLAGVSSGSPAALAGLREGDIIVKFGGATIENIEDLTSELRNKKPGDEIEIVVLRGDQSVSLKAVLGTRS